MKEITKHNNSDSSELQERLEEFLELAKAEVKYESFLRKNSYTATERALFAAALREGIGYAEAYPDWIPYSKQQPKNGDKVICYLDDNTIASYTYYNNNKELVHLFKNHVIAWMYQPPKPIFKDE